MALNFLWQGLPSPNNQPAGDLNTAKLAIFVGVLNGVASSTYLHPCLEQRQYGYGLYQFANYLTAMLGVALLSVDMAFSGAVVGSPAWEPVVKWMVWIAKVLIGAMLQFGLGILHSCLGNYRFRLMQLFA